jgi:hypothetical protein
VVVSAFTLLSSVYNPAIAVERLVSLISMHGHVFFLPGIHAYMSLMVSPLPSLP